jgi:hypothetical protein
MLELYPRLDVVRPLDITEVSAHTQVREMSVLRKRGGQIRKGIHTGKVVIAILTHEPVHRKHRFWVEDMRPSRGNIECIDERSLVLPCSLLIELVGLLKPRPRKI